jgi:hypothetical protein
MVKRCQRWDSFTRAAEWCLAGIISAAIVALHVVYLEHAGALWQDEAEIANLVQSESLGEMWHDMQFHSFPLLYLSLARGWTALGFTNDFALRVLGLLVGFLILAALWITCRRFGSKTPFLALAFFGLSGWMIRSADTLRAYGLGLAVALFFLGSVWRYVEHPCRRHYWLAALTGILAVQTLYQNAVLVLATLLAGMAAALLERQWVRTVKLLTIGLLAMLSLVPYAIPDFGPVSGIFAWNKLIQVSLTWEYILDCLLFAIGPVAGFWCWVSFMAVIGGLTLLLFSILPINHVRQAAAAILGWITGPLRAGPRTSDSQVKRVFLTVAFTAAAGLYGMLLYWLSYRCGPWHFLPFLGFMAVIADGLVEELVRTSMTLRWVRLALVAAAAAISWQPAFEVAQLRYTNLDEVIETLAERAKPDDLILLPHWEVGIVFDRYFRGPQGWYTVPDLDDHKKHRFDLVLKHLDHDKAMDAICDAVSDTLRKGNSVYVVELGRPAYYPPRAAERSVNLRLLDWHAQLQECVKSMSRQIIEGDLSDKRSISPHFLSEIKPPTGNAD